MSAILVFFVHFFALFGSRALHDGSLNSVFLFMATLGHSGVNIFFALSGFVIYGLLIGRPFRYFDFARRRIARLYPAFSFVFVVYLLLNFIFRLKELPSSFLGAASYLLANFLMLPGIFPIIPLITVAWSLSYELCFYLTLPVIVRCLRMPAWSSPARVTLILAICGGHLVGFSFGLLGLPQLVMFGCGILLRETIPRQFRWMRAGNFAALAVFSGVLFLNGLNGNVAWAQCFGPVLGGYGIRLALLFLATYALGFFALSDHGLLSRLFSWDWLRWFGNISYSYYLVHGLVLNILKAGLEFLGLPSYLSPLPFLALYLFSFAATVVGSAAVFLVVEKPSLRVPSGIRPVAAVVTEINCPAFGATGIAVERLEMNSELSPQGLSGDGGV